jgi:alkanesulfonate monooxygenase SsuD/methylene tetrahydromethanopterin reductase-like flavin-dependent oxidoreductase (luciferase family)
MADRLGFSRFWIGEHYTFNYYAPWHNPEPLVPLIAGMTETIRIGIAGLLMTDHMPFRVALNFKLLANLFPDRIDLGFARARPAVPEVIPLLLPQRADEPPLFDKKVSATLDLLRNEDVHAEKGIILPPYKGELPQLWALGISNNGLDSAFRNKMNFSRSLFHRNAGKEYGKDKLLAFKSDYESAYGESPKINMAVAGYCSDKGRTVDSEFKKHYSAYKDIFAPLEDNEQGYVWGTPMQVFEKLSRMVDLYGVEEFIFIDISDNPARRLDTLHLLAEAFALPGAPANMTH